MSKGLDEERIAAEAYQVIGVIADKAGLFENKDVQDALTYFAHGYKKQGAEILPFTIKETV